MFSNAVFITIIRVDSTTQCKCSQSFDTWLQTNTGACRFGEFRDGFVDSFGKKELIAVWFKRFDGKKGKNC